MAAARANWCRPTRRPHSSGARPPTNASSSVSMRAGDERQQLWLWEGGSATALTAAPGVNHDFGAWSPDGSQFAYAANDRDEAHFDVLVRPVGGPARRLYMGTNQLAIAAWHPAGDRLLLLADEAEGDQALLVLSLADGAVHAIPHRRPTAFKSLRWTKSGDLMGLSDCGGRVLGRLPDRRGDG